MFERLSDLVQGAQLQIWVHRAAAYLGAAYALAGRTAEALPLLEQAIEQSVASRMMNDYALWMGWLSEAYLLAGRLDEAHVRAQHALDFSRAHKERSYEAYALRLLGAVAAQRQPPQGTQADAYYRQALSLAEELGMRPLQAHCHRGLGTLYAMLGQSGAGAPGTVCRSRTLPRYGDDLLAAPGGGGAGAKSIRYSRMAM